jgi:metallophosphoesterase superfamily enzyme
LDSHEDKEMRDYLIVNDIHLGVQRNAGTTPKTAVAIKAYLLSNLRELMFAHLDKHIIINGDIFDQFNVSLNDAFDFFLLCKEWLEQSYDTCDLYLAEGNHDLSKNSANMCSLEFVVGALNSERVILVDSPMEIVGHGIYIIPHVANQDMFDMELVKAAELKDTLILVHANYDNNFTLQSDHSLNVSREEALKVIENNNTLMFGHVHQQARPHDRIIVAGNQWPSSVADCLGNTTKQAFIFSPSSRSVNSVQTWTREGSFIELPWEELEYVGEYEFVRVVGKCPTEQAAEMLAAISKYRQRSTAFVVTNAVSVAGVADMADLPASLETVKGFDVLGYLYENLDEEQVKVVKGLLEKANN